MQFIRILRFHLIPWDECSPLALRNGEWNSYRIVLMIARPGENLDELFALNELLY